MAHLAGDVPAAGEGAGWTGGPAASGCATGFWPDEPGGILDEWGSLGEWDGSAAAPL